ncbi:MAG: HAMP domain-containing histidine kinase [Oscillospiraceae bacterium]|nr:HAMP domain-containing histidine kinase [Oscillospiraceae bacterium]
MRKSIAAEYFGLSTTLVAASLILMSSLIICFSLSTYKNDRKELLQQLTEEVRLTSSAYLSAGPEGAEHLKVIFTSAAANTGVDYILFDGEGDALVCSNASPCSHTDDLNVLSMERALPEGHFAMDTMSGYYAESRLNMVYSLNCGGDIYYLSASLGAEGFNKYLKAMIVMFVISFALIMMIIFPLLKYNINRILTPLKQMTLAAKRFGEGDFSEKVKVSDQNEMGFLANTLNEMASSLEAIEENRKSFISNVSHELRTPMTTIGGFVDGILDGTIPENRHREYLRTVSEEINRLARLVRSMLNISKYEAGEMQLQTESFDVTGLTVKTVLLFEKRIEAKKIDIRGLDTGKLYVNADMDLVQQVIYNLTENAVKFVDEGGYISYSFRREENGVAVVIRNSGEGLKKNEINKVFDRFYKTDESRGKDKNGVGLGLSIVRSIIKLHNGSVLVRSKAGKYTEFEFTLPAGEKP